MQPRIGKSLGLGLFCLVLFEVFYLKATTEMPFSFPFRVWKINVMGQEAEPKLKLALVVLINEELEQTHLKHRKGWLKSKNCVFNFRRKRVPEFLDLAKQASKLVLKFSTV